MFHDLAIQTAVEFFPLLILGGEGCIKFPLDRTFCTAIIPTLMPLADHKVPMGYQPNTHHAGKLHVLRQCHWGNFNILTLYKPMTYKALWDFQLHAWCRILQCSWEIGSAWAEGWDRGRWVGAPRWCKQHGCSWAWPWNALGWSLAGNFTCFRKKFSLTFHSSIQGWFLC